MFCAIVTVPSYHISPCINDYIIGDIKSALFDENGGNFHISEHGVIITVPKMAIPCGQEAEIQFAATLIAPVKFSSNAKPVSAIIWLCMNVQLVKPIELQVSHCVNVETKDHSKTLQFAKCLIHHSREDVSTKTMEVIEGGDFPIGKSYGIIKIDHFCYYCIQSIEAVDIPKNLYEVITMKETQPNIRINLWNIHVCIIPSLPTCFKVHLIV